MKLLKFLLKPKCGDHVEPDANGKPVKYVAGDVVPSKIDLVRTFPEKFELVEGQEVSKGEKLNTPSIPLPNEVKREITNVESETPEPIESETPSESEYGQDVSDEFPTASEVNLKVFEKSKWYTVIDPEEDNEVLNEKKLRKNAVEDFLAQYLSDDDADDED